MNIYQKISAVMNDVQYLCKDDHVKFGTTDYKAISEEKVTATVRESLIKNGIVIVPIGQEHRRDGTLSIVDVSYRIQNIDDPEDFVVAKSSGSGTDTQDKGVGKAMTYAYKYLLLRTFAIPTGEDPDKISSEELDKKARDAAEKAKKDAEEKSKAEAARNAKIDATKVIVFNDKVTSTNSNLVNLLAVISKHVPPTVTKVEDLTVPQFTFGMGKMEEKLAKPAAN